MPVIRWKKKTHDRAIQLSCFFIFVFLFEHPCYNIQPTRTRGILETKPPYLGMVYVVYLWSADYGQLHFFFLPFQPPIAKLKARFDWSPEFTGRGSFFRFPRFGFFALFTLVRALKVTSTLPTSFRKPIASSIHSLGFPSPIDLYRY